METKINIAEILKDKPKGIRLYSPIFCDCTFSFIQGVTDAICVIANDNREFFDYKGLYSPMGECLLFPSKEMRDWSKFSWKKGDLLINSCGFQCIFKEWASNDYTKFNGCYSNSKDGYEDVSNAKTAKFDKLDNNIAYGYVREIERKLGGKLNRETLEIEKAQSFKDGDVITIMPHIGDKLIYLFKAEDDEKYYGHAFLDGNIAIVNEDSYCYKDFCTAHPSTDEEKQQLFDALAKKGKAWDAEKKQIVDLKPKWTPKPFDKVLVRDEPYGSWEPALFWKRVDVQDLHPYMVIGGKRYRFCEPYESNEYFLNN